MFFRKKKKKNKVETKYVFCVFFVFKNRKQVLKIINKQALCFYLFFFTLFHLDFVDHLLKHLEYTI